MSSICSKAASNTWLAFDAMVTAAAAAAEDPHSPVTKERVREAQQKDRASGYSPSLSHLDFFYRKPTTAVLTSERLPSK